MPLLFRVNEVSYSQHRNVLAYTNFRSRNNNNNNNNNNHNNNNNFILVSMYLT